MARGSKVVKEQETLQLVKYPNRPLLQRCAQWDFALETEPVTGLTLSEIVQRMLTIMYDNHGVGLAANQVGLCWRFFVADLDAGTDKEGTTPFVVINPELTNLDGQQSGKEGCLSIHAGIRFPVRRAESCHLKGYDINGTAFEVDARGFASRLFQHEVDHLDGKCCIDLTDKYSRAIAMKKWARMKGRRR